MYFPQNTALRAPVLALLCAASSLAQKPDVEALFETEVRPVLVKRCGMCHQAKNPSGGLALDTHAGFRKGGNSGEPAAAAIRKALAGASPFMKMPLGAPLPAPEMAALKRWLDAGAEWPAPRVSADAAGQSDPRDFWAFRPVRKPALPAVRNTAWPASGIDRFILATLEAKKLDPAPDADKRELLRRISFDLTGLPPSPADLASFLKDMSPNAYEKAVDRLLASPAYGERWGRHWMDVARYADTSGDTADYPIPQAFRYRDWVIRALNEDLSYRDFLRYQIAGDILAADETDATRYSDKTVATGFIALSHRFGNNKTDLHLTIEDTIDTLGRGVLGLTLRCARCHDHKFDPMSVQDYYGMYGIFASTRYPWAGASDSSFPSNMAFLSPDANVRAEAERRFNKLADYVRQINDNKYVPKPERERYAGLLKRIAEADAKGEDSGQLVRERDALLEKHKKFREFLVNGLDWLKAEADRMAADPLPCDVAFAVAEGDPKDAAIQRGGDPERPGKVVPRQFVEVAWNREIHPMDRASGGSGRLALANWLASDDNPLTRRVLVNRVWHYHFGRGIVATPDNFGHRGERPTHPELLDYLAAVFAEDGWSLKKLHRRIVLSRTYRMSSAWHSANAVKDPGNVYLWRHSPRRLDAESIRDAMLAVAGDLDRSPAGAHPFLPWWKKKWNLNSPFREVFEHNRRSVYLMTQRLFQHPFLELFDGANTNQTTAVRDSSQMATQALYLMNSPFVRDRAKSFAQRIREASPQDAGRIESAFSLAFGRSPRPSEEKAGLRFLEAFRKAQSAGEGTEWEAFAWSILTANEFFFTH